MSDRICGQCRLPHHDVSAELADGRSVVIKVRPFEPRIAGCAAVQARLAATGFPCPLPLAGPAAVRGFAVTAETWVPGGGQRPPGHGAAPFAALLARLVGSAPGAASVPGHSAADSDLRLQPAGRQPTQPETGPALAFGYWREKNPATRRGASGNVCGAC